MVDVTKTNFKAASKKAKAALAELKFTSEAYEIAWANAHLESGQRGEEGVRLECPWYDRQCEGIGNMLQRYIVVFK